MNTGLLTGVHIGMDPVAGLKTVNLFFAHEVATWKAVPVLADFHNNVVESITICPCALYLLVSFLLGYPCHGVPSPYRIWFAEPPGRTASIRRERFEPGGVKTESKSTPGIVNKYRVFVAFTHFAQQRGAGTWQCRDGVQLLVHTLYLCLEFIRGSAAGVP